MALWDVKKHRIFILRSREFNCVDYFTLGNEGNTFLLKVRNH
jgi:hypothetical protein